MRHATETNLIKLAAGELTGAERSEIEQHLAACEQCRALAAKHASLRALLGEWTIDAGGRDLWPTIERGLDSPRPVVLRPAWGRLAELGRVAALVAVGVGLGHVTARLTQLAPARDGGSAATFNDEELAGALGLYSLESPSATGLVTTVFEITAPGDAAEVAP